MDDKLFCKLPSKLVDFELAIAICEVEMSLVISIILPNVGRYFRQFLNCPCAKMRLFRTGGTSK